MNCETISLILHGLLDGELTPQERGAVELHLDECAICREELMELQALDATLNRTLRPPSRNDRARDLSAPSPQPCGERGFLLSTSNTNDYRQLDPVIDRIVDAVTAIANQRNRIQPAEPFSNRHFTSQFNHRQRSGQSVVSPHKTATSALLLLVFSLVMALGVAFQLPAEMPTVAEVTIATGSIDVQNSSTSKWTVIGSRSPISLAAHTRIRTRDNSLCEIRTKSDAVVRLNHETELVVHRSEQIELVTGELWCRTPSTKALEISTGNSSHQVNAAASFTCPTSSESQWQTFPDQELRCTGVSTSAIEVAMNSSHENCTVSPGETVCFTAANVLTKSGYTDRLEASTWQLPLLILRGPRDPELKQRLTELLAAAGQSKMAYLYEEQIRQLGAPGTLPLVAFVRSPESHEQPALRHSAMRIIADLAPRSSVTDIEVLLNDIDPTVRQLASRALQRLWPDRKSGIE